MHVTNERLEELLAPSSDPAKEVWDPSEQRLIMQGFYQTRALASYFRDMIRGDFAASIRRANPWRSRIGANNDTFVHMRLGDKASRTNRGADAFIRAVGAPHGRVYIASDSPGHPLVQSLATHFTNTSLFGSEVLAQLRPVETIQFGSTCATLVISEGTFGWTIAAFASNASRVRVVPRHYQTGTGPDMAFFPPDWQIM